MLSEWVRSHLLPKPAIAAPSASAPPPSVEVGTVLCTAIAPSTNRPADRCLLREQFLHKAVLLVLAEATDADGTVQALGRLSVPAPRHSTARVLEHSSAPWLSVVAQVSGEVRIECQPLSF